MPPMNDSPEGQTQSTVCKYHMADCLDALNEEEDELCA
jgi:hypothetical protein